MLHRKTCLYCNTEFSQKTGNYGNFWRKFCSSSCKQKWHSEHGRKPVYPHLSTSTIGALHELLVATDLMKRGYHVFRALSPSCVCDLAIVKDNVFLRIEVRTGSRSKTGKIHYQTKHLDPEKFDVKAIYLKREGKIIYKPKLKKAVKLARKEKQFT